MSEEEIKKEAVAIFWRIAKFSPKTSESESFKLAEDTAGTPGFFISYNEPNLGSGYVFYSPIPFVEGLIRNREREGSLLKKQSEIKLYRMYWQQKIETIVAVLCRTIQGDFKSAFATPGVFAHLVFSQAAEEVQSEQEKIAKIKQALADQTNMANKTRAYYVNKIKNRRAAPKALFCHIYEAQKDLWSEARDFYNAVKKFTDPLGKVKREYPYLHEELLEKLADDDPYVSQPANIALLATAGITQLSKESKSIRSLYDYLKESKDLNAALSKEEVMKMLLEYKDRMDKAFDLHYNLQNLMEDILPPSDSVH